VEEQKPKRNGVSKYTAMRIERQLYRKARRRARARHQTYSEYVRQLIVRDIAEKEANAVV
jgi:hypothetical protein